MNDDRAETIEIIEQQGSFLLIHAGPRFAVVEKRAGHVYPMKPGEREGEPLTPEGLAAAMAGGLLDRNRPAEAQRGEDEQPLPRPLGSSQKRLDALVNHADRCL